MKKNVVFVTGGAGYIGSHACKVLAKSGFIPVTLDNLSTGWKDSVKFGPFEMVDLKNKSNIDNLFIKYKPDAVMHFAALSQVGESMKSPDIYWENNVLGSLNLIKSAVENSCMKFVFSSTCAIYCDIEQDLMDEHTPYSPDHAYGASKLAVENILSNFGAAYGLNYVTFRYFNVAGADPEREIGELHKPETHIIPLLFETISGKRKSFTIFGTDYDTFDGTCIRDYVHVCDLIDAHLSGLRWLMAGKKSRTFNLGTGTGFSVREVIEQVKIVTNKSVEIVEGRRAGDARKLVSGSTRPQIN